ncbi:hypothetical protein ETB97_006996 [Aspergillus alliaceus]|uniref:L-ornithine N(5)-monooxygenase n=1 Tax=Petromyces alliaceus TaxID=209559 RepID=A0A8H6E323_PETAA|nr:hypothetical protein ETB97_006996 [Aspergillus burnettii]
MTRGLSGGFPSYPIYEPQRRLRVLVIGAGASGLLLAYKLQRHFDQLDLLVFEKNPAVAGTWFENTYPGCACDVPSHCYTWSFEPNPRWSATYAGSQEIRQYFTHFCDRHGLSKYIRLQHEVIRAEWQADKSQWAVDVRDLQRGEDAQHTADIVVDATGILNRPRWPAIEGLSSFKGAVVHTAVWDHSVRLKDKTVAVIGNGSSGIQVLPAILPSVHKIVHFIRQPAWISPPVEDGYRQYSQSEIDRFVSDPAALLAERRRIEQRMNSAFPMFIHGSDHQKYFQHGVRTAMEQQLVGHEQLQDTLIPNFPFGCRRPTPGPGYLQALTDPKVQVISGAAISQVTEDSMILDDGRSYEVDAIVCATGFNTSYVPRFPVVGQKGQKLWEDGEVSGYLGLAVPGFPNYFNILGPNCPVGNGPVLIVIEQQVSYIIQMLAKLQKENRRACEVSEEATRTFNAWKDSFMQHTVWTSGCRSWYHGGGRSDRVVALWPGSTLHYLEATQQPRYEDWIWTADADSNPWAFLGNGSSSAEARPGGDLSWYLRTEDDEPVDPCLTQKRSDDEVNCSKKNKLKSANSCHVEQGSTEILV